MPASTRRWPSWSPRRSSAFEKDLGWRVEQVKTPWGPKGPELARFFWPAHFTRHAERLPEFRDRMDPGFVACIEAGC